MSFIGPILKVKEFNLKSYFASGPSIHQLLPNGGDHQHQQFDATAAPQIRTILTLPFEGRIINTFDVCDSGFALACHNEVFFFFNSVDTTKNSSYTFCGRSLDRIVDIQFMSGTTSIVCLGNEGTVVIFEQKNSSSSATTESGNEQFSFSQKFLTGKGHHAPFGMCLSGSLILNDHLHQNEGKNNKQEKEVGITFRLGTSSGDVNTYFVPMSNATITQNDQQRIDLISSIKKVHTNGMVSSMTQTIFDDDVDDRIDENDGAAASFGCFCCFATGSDERRACFVYSSSSNETTFNVLQLPYEQGRIRSVDCFKGATLKNSKIYFVCVASEDGIIKLYEISFRNHRQDPPAFKLLFSEKVHGAGLSGGAASVALIRDHQQQHRNRSVIISILSGGLDGKIAWSRPIFQQQSNDDEKTPSTKSGILISKFSQDHESIRCLSVFGNDTKATIVACLATGEIYFFERTTTTTSSKKYQVAKLPHSSSALVPSCVEVLCSKDDDEKLIVVVGTTNGQLFLFSLLLSLSITSKLISTTSIPHPSSIMSIVTSSKFSHSSSTNNNQRRITTPIIIFTAASGTIGFWINDDNNNKSEHDEETSAYSSITINGLTEGRTILLTQQRQSAVDDHLFCFACDRRGVYVVELVSSCRPQNNSTTASSSSSNNHLLPRLESTSSNSSHQFHTFGEKIYHSAQAFPGRADLWCPVSMHWEQENSFFTVIHKNRMFQTFQFNFETRKTTSISVPLPICHDLPVRDVLFSAFDRLLVQKGNDLILWDRKRNCQQQQKSENNSSSSGMVENMTATRMKNISQDGHLFVWSPDSKTIMFNRFSTNSCEKSNVDSSSTSPSSLPQINTNIDGDNNLNNKQQQQQQQLGVFEALGASDLTCVTTLENPQQNRRGLIVVGADEGALTFWGISPASNKNNDNNSSIDNTTLLEFSHQGVALLHSASVLAVCPISLKSSSPEAYYCFDGFVSVGAHSTIGMWRRQSTSSISSSSSSYNLFFSKVAAPIQTQNKSAGRLREAELERFLCCDSKSTIVAVGSSNGDVLLFDISNETAITENRIPLQQTKTTTATETKSPVMSICIVPSSSSSFSLLCGLNNGKLTCVHVSQKTPSQNHHNNQNERTFVVVDSIIDNCFLLPEIEFEYQDPMNQLFSKTAAITKSDKFLKPHHQQSQKTRIELDGAVTALKYDPQYQKLYAARESGNVFVFSFVDINNRAEMIPQVFVINNTRCAAVPRSLVLMPSTSSPCIVEEGRKYCKYNWKTNETTTKFSSVCRIRGGDLISIGGREIVVVVGQGMEVLE